MKWKCTNCGNKMNSASQPRVCGISCCGQENTYIVDNDPTPILAPIWKCTNCGNQSSETLAPNKCPILCCLASNSYVSAL
ncbi:MAG: hypothetical protein GQ527_04995 [Bacteroidales bacterium]|nr:hypothetical protein [Bacteroidales bacterium]